MNKINIAAVSYINTFPFIYGIENANFLNGMYNLSQLVPSQCADYLIEGKVDLGLVPVAILNQMKNKEIVSDYCIGASRQVKSVMLLSNSKLENIKRIFLDYQSRTSVMLVKILSHFYWQINIVWENTNAGFEKIDINDDEGVLIIGDRVFNIMDKFENHYDLAQEWIEFTGLPFVFAAWVANKTLSSEFKTAFNKSLEYGVNHISESIMAYNKQKYSIDLESYLNNNIDYNFDEMKYKGMNKFIDYLNKLPL